MRNIERGAGRICVVTAADIEFKTVAGLLLEPSFAPAHGVKCCHGRAGEIHVTLWQAEVGAAGFDEKLTAHLAENDYDRLLIIGLAGALVPELRTGAVLLYDRCFRLDARLLADGLGMKKANFRDSSVPVACDPRLTDVLAQAFRASGVGCELGTAVTTDVMVTSAATKLALGAVTGAAAVDMESYAVIEVARRCGVPVAVVRVILDEAGQDTPDFNRALTADGKMKLGPLLLAMAARPAVTARFLRSLTPALRALRRAAESALSGEVRRAFRASRSGPSRADAKSSLG